MQADPNQQTKAQRLLHFPPMNGPLPCGPIGVCLQFLSCMKCPFLISSSPTTPYTSLVTLAQSRPVGSFHSPAHPVALARRPCLPCISPSPKLSCLVRHFSCTVSTCKRPTRNHLRTCQSSHAQPTPTCIRTCLVSLPRAQPFPSMHAEGPTNGLVSLTTTAKAVTYPVATKLQNRCANIMMHLFNAPSSCTRSSICPLPRHNQRHIGLDWLCYYV